MNLTAISPSERTVRGLHVRDAPLFVRHTRYGVGLQSGCDFEAMPRSPKMKSQDKTLDLQN